MHLATQPTRLLSLLLAGLAWLVLASGIGRALVVCTEACGAEHVTFAHVHGTCGHAGEHDHAHTHTHDPLVAAADLVDSPQGIDAPTEAQGDDPDGSCDDRALGGEAATRPVVQGAPHLPPCLAGPRLAATPFECSDWRLGNTATTQRPRPPGGSRAMLVLRI